MQRSTNRILTTHTGSLPRPEPPGRAHVRQGGRQTRRRRAARSTSPRVRRRGRAPAGEAGIDVVSDGEMSKPSYATYVTERLTGFGGASEPPEAQRPARLSERREQVLQRSRRAAAQHEPPCLQRSGRARRHERDAASRHRELPRALAGGAVEDAFMTAASPGRRVDVPRQHVLHDRGGVPVGGGRGDEARVRGDHRRRASCCSSTARTSR